jgi:hypothetical protein
MRITSRGVGAWVTAGAGIALLAGCTADDGGTPLGGADPSAVASSSPSPTATAASPPPSPSADELARIDFEAIGPDGIPTASSVAFDGTGPASRLRVEGACEGISVSYAIRAVGDGMADQSVAAGTVDCAAPRSVAEVNVDVAGPLQVLFTSTDGATSGWIRVLAA